MAERLAREALAEAPPPGSVSSSPRLQDKPIVAPDPKVDRLIEEYLQLPDYMERIKEAERRVVEAMRSGSMAEVRGEDVMLAGSDPPGQGLFRALSEPYPALVQGVCELVDELIEADPADDRIGTLVAQLCLGLYRHPDLIPVEKFQRWVANHAVFGDEMRAWLYERLAAVEPGWIVEHNFPDAFSVSIAAKASSFFSDIGVYAPGLLRQIVERYLLEAEWDRDITSRLMRALEKAARRHPEEAPATIALIERLRGGPPKAGVIDFRYIELSKTLDSLRSVEEKDEP